MKNKIKEIRESLNMSQEELAEKSGLTRPHISNIENNKQCIVKSVTMFAIAEALQRPINEIFFTE